LTALLQVEQLRVSFDTPRGVAQAVDGVSFSVAAGQTLCVVGESGCGKSVTALSIMGLVPRPPARLSGQIRFEGRDLLSSGAGELADLRGNRIAMIFQEPMTSLNPAFTVGSQLSEVLMRHRGLDRAAAHEASVAMLRRVSIPAPEQRIHDFPHRLSGGMRQRVMIAMALVCRPALLVADEPTTALDVTIQNQILTLIDELRSEIGAAVLFITHNLAVVAEIADEIAVMYAGRIVERGSRAAIFDDPLHPYTLALFAALPRRGDAGRKLACIDGQVPAPSAMPQGCRFAPRCPFAIEHCRQETPPLAALRPGHDVACWRAPIEEHMA